MQRASVMISPETADNLRALAFQLSREQGRRVTLGEVVGLMLAERAGLADQPGKISSGAR